MHRRKKHNIITPYINDQEYKERRGFERVKKEYEENTHHILARSLGGTNHPDNLTKLYVPIHNALHRVLGNGDIRDQIKRVMKISEKATTRELQQDIEKVLQERDIRYYYKEDVFKDGHYF